MTDDLEQMEASYALVRDEVRRLLDDGDEILAGTICRFLTAQLRSFTDSVMMIEIERALRQNGE